MNSKFLVAAALLASSTFLSATVALASSQTSTSVSTPSIEAKPALSFDCGDVSVSQLTDLQNKSSASDLKDLAKHCDEQAEDYELKAKDALQANNKADVSFLREKAANAYLNVAVFTNSSLFKN